MHVVKSVPDDENCLTPRTHGPHENVQSASMVGSGGQAFTSGTAVKNSASEAHQQKHTLN
jgi:hypothetical protein